MKKFVFALMLAAMTAGFATQASAYDACQGNFSKPCVDARNAYMRHGGTYPPGYNSGGYYNNNGAYNNNRAYYNNNDRGYWNGRDQDRYQERRHEERREERRDHHDRHDHE